MLVLSEHAHNSVASNSLTVWCVAPDLCLQSTIHDLSALKASPEDVVSLLGARSSSCRVGSMRAALHNNSCTVALHDALTNKHTPATQPTLTTLSLSLSLPTHAQLRRKVSRTSRNQAGHNLVALMPQAARSSANSGRCLYYVECVFTSPIWLCTDFTI